MLRYIHFSDSLPKLLGRLCKTGKKTELAAIKCETILNDIRKYGCQYETVHSKRTRHGESRIKNCIKYDLGGGYRLVTIRVGCHLFICFVGTHDEANLWIERHRYDILTPDDPLYRCEERVIQLETDETDCCESAGEHDIEEQYEDELRARLDEAQLKTIFKGLSMNPASLTDKADNCKTSR